MTAAKIAENKQTFFPLFYNHLYVYTTVWYFSLSLYYRITNSTKI